VQDLQPHGQFSGCCPLLCGLQESGADARSLECRKQDEVVHDELARRLLEPRVSGLPLEVDDDDEAGVRPATREQLVLKRRVEAAELALNDVPIGGVMRGARERLIRRNARRRKTRDTSRSLGLNAAISSSGLIR
jgi:hypothetical protein